jgi:hypothetical protein
MCFDYSSACLFEMIIAAIYSKFYVKIVVKVQPLFGLFLRNLDQIPASQIL